MATGSIVVATLALVPLTFMVAAAAVAFGPVLGSAYAMIGALLSAAIVYGAGALLGERWATKLFGRRWRRIGDTISGRGVLAVAMVRLVPVAPYSVVNFLAGALRVRFIDFILGTALGLTPGIIALSLFGAQLGSVLREPDWLNVSLLIVFSLAILVGIGFGIRWLRRSHDRRRRSSRLRRS